MKTKQTIVGILCLILMLTTSFVVNAVVSSGGKLDISVISQEPDPAEPGEVIDVRFKVENTGFDKIDDISFEVVEKYPFSVYTGEVQRKINSLQALQKDSLGVILLYKIKVDEEAIEGTNYIDVRYKLGNNDWVTIEDLDIRLRTRDNILSLEGIKTEPQLVEPGKEFELSITLRNNADSLIRDVTLDLDFSASTSPFAPSTSTAEKQIYQINSKIGKIMTFDLIALPDAEGGVYKIPVTITYSDEAGTAYTKEDYISLKISSTPNLLITVDSSEVMGDVKKGDIVIKIVNRGLTDIKLVTSELGESEDYEVISNAEVYVGNIDSDDYETVEYNLAVNSYEKSIELPLTLSYMDSTNKEYSEETILELKTYSNSLVATIISGFVGLIIRLAILVGIVFYSYKFYKKRKAKRKG